MSCAEAVERMPWLANATLSESEERALTDHVSRCPACSEELRRTRLLAAAFQEHPTAETLAAYAEGTVGVDREDVERHLRRCTDCADLATRASQSWESYREAAPNPVPGFRTRTPRRHALWAAGFVTLAASGAWLLTWQQWARDRDAWRQREAALEQRLVEGVGRVPVRTAGRAVPRLNVPVVELLARRVPGSLRAPAAAGAALNELRLTEGATEVTFVLLGGQSDEAGGGRVEILGGDGSRLWSAEGLVANAEGDFTLTLPVELLPPARFTIVVRPAGAGSRPVHYDVQRLRTGSR